MKKKLLKSLLLVTAMLLGLSVNAQQIRAKWTVPADAETGLCSIKTATGYGEKLFGVNCDAGTVEEWEDGVLIASYDVNKFCADNQYGEMLYVTGATGDVIYQEFITYTLWGAVMVDDAGNILANVWSTSSETSCQNWVLLPANDRTKMQLLHIDEFPSSDVTLGYVDMPSRIVGDITGEGAYLYITPASSTYMPIIFIGLDDKGKIYYNNELSWVLPSSKSFDSTTNVATLQTFDDIHNAEEVGIVAAKTYIRWSGQDSPFTWDAEAGQFAKDATIPQGIDHPGMDVFKIGDVEYIVVPVRSATTRNRGSSVAVYNLADGTEVAAWDAVSAANYYEGSVQARVNPDGKTANIYVCSRKDCFGIFEFNPQSSSAAITSITLDKTELTLSNSQTAKLNVSVTTNDGSTISDFTWSSNNASVATVDAEGTVTAVAEGTAYITVRPNGKSTSVSCKVTVFDIISNGINYSITSNIEPYTVEVIEGNYTGDIVIPESIEKDEITYTVKSIKSNAFRSCEITSIAIPESIENIGERAFEGCKSLTSIVIPNSVKSINSNTFSNCSCLTSVVIPESVSTIGYYAFHYCTSLKNIIIPEGVNAIEDGAFWQCYDLETITLPSTLNSIGESAFASEVVSGENENGGLVMEKFNRKIICNATTPPTLRGGAFSCNIITMEVPFASMMAYKEDESWARYDITYLSKEVEGQNYLPTSETEIAFSAKDTESENYTGDVVIPGEVTIDEQTYTVSSIGESAFADCTEITSVSIPESISTIAGTAFDGCTGLKLLDVSESTALTSISSNTFSTCTAIETVNFPTSIESIGASAFANCANLSNMSLPCTTPPALDNENNPFEGVDATACIISIPTESVSAYTQSVSWSKFVDPSAKSDIQISVVNNESENENTCTIKFKKFIDNTIEPAELMANNIKATLAEDEVVSEEIPDAMTGNGQSLYVANGDAVTFHIIPDESKEIESIIYNDENVTSQLVENKFTTPAVSAKSSLQVILKNGTPTGVEDNFIEEAKVIEMARYDISGRLLSAPVKGLNIVKMSDGTMKKVIVK